MSGSKKMLGSDAVLRSLEAEGVRARVRASVLDLLSAVATATYQPLSQVTSVRVRK